MARDQIKHGTGDLRYAVSELTRQEVPQITVTNWAAKRFVEGERLEAGRGRTVFDGVQFAEATLAGVLLRFGLAPDIVREAVEAARPFLVRPEHNVLVIPITGDPKVLPRSHTPLAAAIVGVGATIVDLREITKRLHEMFRGKILGIEPSDEREAECDRLGGWEPDEPDPRHVERMAEIDRELAAAERDRVKPEESDEESKS